jgi:hypothetical protein
LGNFDSYHRIIVRRCLVALSKFGGFVRILAASSLPEMF